MSERSQLFESRTAIVTGGSSGIGRRVAVELASAGARTVVVGRNEGRLNLVAEAIRESGGACHTIVCDLTTEGTPQAVAEEAMSVYGSIDVLVHSAGIVEPHAFASVPLSSLDRVFNVNLRAPFILSQAALPYMRGRKGSSIIFISSVSSRAGFLNDSVYAASKAAIDGLTRALAVELAPDGVRVNAVSPGFTETPINEAFRAKKPVVERVVGATLAGRLATVDDIAASVVFLASELSSYLYGVILPVDGGYPTASVQSGGFAPA